MHFHEPFGGLLPGARGAVLSVLLRTDAPLTGRQIHGLLSESCSLWSVQEALKALSSLGLVESTAVGRAHVHAINQDHVAVEPLRALADPVAALKDVVASFASPEVVCVLLFGSIARGESGSNSDVDLAVVTRDGEWDRRAELAETVHSRLGNTCDVLILGASELDERARRAEPVVGDILRDGVALVGTKPRLRRRATNGVG